MQICSWQTFTYVVMWSSSKNKFDEDLRGKEKYFAHKKGWKFYCLHFPFIFWLYFLFNETFSFFRYQINQNFCVGWRGELRKYFSFLRFFVFFSHTSKKLEFSWKSLIFIRFFKVLKEKMDLAKVVKRSRM